MADPLGEILSSPLDEPSGSRTTRGDAAILLIALLVGTAAGWVVGGRAAESVDATTATTAAAVPAPSEFPPGFVDIGFGYGAGVSWMFTRGPDLYVGVTFAGSAQGQPVTVGATGLGTDLVANERRGIGIWSVELSGGERVDHSREMFDAAAPGVVTLEFSGIGASVEDVRRVWVRPRVGAGTRVHGVEVAVESLPSATTAIEPLAATERIEQTEQGTTRTDLTYVTVDELTLDWSSASMTWTLQDDPGVRVMIDVFAVIEGDTVDPVQLQTVSGAAFLQRVPPPASPATRGTEVLRKVAGPAREAYRPARARLTITVSWLRYGDVSYELPLEGATLLAPID